MPCSANDIVALAKTQIGVCEKPAKSNKTKYGKEFGANGEPWCAIFLWWCFKHAEASGLFPHNSNAADAQDLIVSRCGGKWIMKKTRSASTRKDYLKKAKPGDVVCFDFGRFDAWRSHIGIVEYVSGNYLICIEGNTSKTGSQSNGGMVCRQRRIYTSVCSAARPKYSTGPAPTPKPYTGTFPTLPKRGWFQKGDKGAQVSNLQRLLNWAIDETLIVDGELGPATVEAIRDYQRQYGLKVDGGFGSECLKKAKTIKK